MYEVYGPNGTNGEGLFYATSVQSAIGEAHARRLQGFEVVDIETDVEVYAENAPQKQA